MKNIKGVISELFSRKEEFIFMKKKISCHEEKYFFSWRKIFLFMKRIPLTSYKLEHDKALIISPKPNKRTVISNKKTTANILMKVK